MTSLSELGVQIVGTVSTSDTVPIQKINYLSPWLKDKINGYISIQTSDGYFISLPDPVELKITEYDVDSSTGTGRNQYGDLIRDRVAIKEKLNCTFPRMMRYDYQIMLALTKDVSFNVRYYSDLYRGFVTKKMYVGDRNPGIGKRSNNFVHPEEQRVDQFEMNFIEF